MADCLFCRIVAGELPARKVYEDEEVLAFRDIQPVAPVHVLVVPKRHLDGLAAAGAEDAPLLGRLLDAARRVAEAEGLAEGYRVVVNQGRHGGQSVGHLHLHVLGGRAMQWPPG
ncbi:MAG: histidine triad nucleotide-binding protein [Firmicutes bacterium]|nr:histidine triad nucleotide-binding protein [Bacillota bacterium]